MARKVSCEPPGKPQPGRTGSCTGVQERPWGLGGGQAGKPRHLRLWRPLWARLCPSGPGSVGARTSPCTTPLPCPALPLRAPAAGGLLTFAPAVPPLGTPSLPFFLRPLQFHSPYTVSPGAASSKMPAMNNLLHPTQAAGWLYLNTPSRQVCK